MEVIQVQPRDFYLHYIYVPVKGTSIRWTFTTKKNNIAFGLYRRLGLTPLPSTSDIVLKAQQQTARSEPPKQHIYNKKLDESSSVHSMTFHSRARSKSVASEKLNEKSDLIELIPIEHVNSVKIKVEGSYTVHEPGNYVLVFDNTFSKNTPKVVTFSVALVDPNMEQPIDHPPAEISGWLLKKRRKKLQGWAKRWFELSTTGVLSYSASPTSLTRGSIQILLATISLNPPQRMFHIDSGSSLFHIRCQTDDEFKQWAAALKRFKNDEQQQQEPEQHETPEIQLPDNDYHSADIIWLKIDAGIRNAELLASNIALHQKNTETLFSQQHLDSEKYTLMKENELIGSLAQDQAKQWREVQIAIQRVLNADASLNSLKTHNSRTEENKDLLRTKSTSTTCSSFISEKFFDAESILSIDDEDEDDHPIDTDSTTSTSYDDDEELENEEDDDDIDSFMLKGNKSQRESQLLRIISEPSNFHRRQILPSASVNDGTSALSIFRKNIGKDLSQIAMPVSMNEPLSMLQKACEDLEYSELLDTAAQCQSSIDRLMYIATFAISSYASSQWRSGRKPFNPMMTETYECIRPDKGFRFMSEKVSHHPLMIASHAESQHYQYWQCTKVKSKFWGKSMEFMSEGTFHVRLHDEHYTFTKPSSWMRNMIAGEKYLEHVGEMKVVNETTQEYAIVTFKEGTGGGLFSAPKERNHVVGVFYTKDGTKAKRIVGKWNDQIAEDVNMDGKTWSVLWKAKEPSNPDFSKKYYGFTQFAIELNEITPIEKGKLPKTDSRLRPDQRLYEEGELDRADQEKLRIEAKQRRTRAEFAEKNVPWLPRWFKLDDESSQELEVSTDWSFTGEYWKTRETGEWPQDIPDLW